MDLTTYVFVNVVEGTVIRNESSELLAVLNQLYTDCLTDGRVRLFGFNTPLKLIFVSKAA